MLHIPPFNTLFSVSVTIPKVPAVIFGDSLSLECNLDPSSAKSSITWIPPENSGCHQIKHYGSAISIKDVSRCHIGVWTCKVNYDGREAEATTTVSVIGETHLLNTQCIYPFISVFTF